MKQLNFESNLTSCWQECKHQFREYFWDEIHRQILGGVKHMIQELIQTEFNTLIGARPYERTSSRKTKRNGYYTRSLETRYGRIEQIQAPRARNLDIRFLPL